MSHKQSVDGLQKVVAPMRATGWFIRGRIWVLGYWKDGQRHELARGDDHSHRDAERILREAIRAFRKER